jgi:hypothetical protein
MGVPLSQRDSPFQKKIAIIKRLKLFYYIKRFKEL